MRNKPNNKTILERRKKTLLREVIQPNFIIDYLEKFGESNFEICSNCIDGSYVKCSISTEE